LSDADMPRDAIEQAILRRGSSRKFARIPITLTQLSTILDRATHGVSADFLDPLGAQLNDLYLIVHAVEVLDPGAYIFHRERRLLECLKAGTLPHPGPVISDWTKSCPPMPRWTSSSLADLRPILQPFGKYRAVQLEAGIIGGRLYLAAYAQRLGATGLTFYDDEVTRFFSPHAEGKSAFSWWLSARVPNGGNSGVADFAGLSQRIWLKLGWKRVRAFFDSSYGGRPSCRNHHIVCCGSCWFFFRCSWPLGV
jgi:hypothetical protein